MLQYYYSRLRTQRTLRQAGTPANTHGSPSSKKNSSRIFQGYGSPPIFFYTNLHCSHLSRISGGSAVIRESSLQTLLSLVIANFDNFTRHRDILTEVSVGSLGTIGETLVCLSLSLSSTAGPSSETVLG